MDNEIYFELFFLKNDNLSRKILIAYYNYVKN